MTKVYLRKRPNCSMCGQHAKATEHHKFTIEQRDLYANISLKDGENKLKRIMATLLFFYEGYNLEDGDKYRDLFASEVIINSELILNALDFYIKAQDLEEE